jgi:hypothetical protein
MDSFKNISKMCDSIWHEYSNAGIEFNHITIDIIFCDSELTDLSLTWRNPRVQIQTFNPNKNQIMDFEDCLYKIISKYNNIPLKACQFTVFTENLGFSTNLPDHFSLISNMAVIAEKTINGCRIIIRFIAIIGRT